MTDEIKFWTSLLGPVVVFIIVQIVAYNKMKWDLNGIGKKLRAMDIENQLHQKEILQRVAKIEGILQGKNQ